MATPTVEFRIPISPAAGMYSNVRLAARSLAVLGPPYANARILVSVGDAVEHERVLHETPWARDFPIEWRVADHRAVDLNPHTASGNDRYLDGPRADVVILCDADTCVVDRFDDLLSRLSVERPTVAGLHAHISPFAEKTPAKNDLKWAELFSAANLAGKSLDFAYSFFRDGAQGHCPAYFNYGFIAFNRLAFHRVGPLVAKQTELARQKLGTFGEREVFQSQIGLALALAVADVDILPLGHAYNCANDERVFENGLTSADEAKIIHYLRTNEFDRGTFLCNRSAYQKFVEKPLRNAVSERLRRHVLGLGDVHFWHTSPSGS